jgi:3-dehydroquinate dehydratase-2
MAKAKKTARTKGPRILVASGVNLDLLGRREPGIYGKETLDEIEAMLRDAAPGLAELAGVPTPELEFYQTNDEEAYLKKLDEGFAGAVLNPGAWTHTSLALADRLKALALPYVEVHLSNLAGREDFRKHSYAAPGAAGVVHGFGGDSYRLGLLGLLIRLAKARVS